MESDFRTANRITMERKMNINVFLADDHTILRDGLRSILESQTGISVIGDAADGQMAVDEIKRLNPHVAIMDISMPKLNGIEACGILAQECTHVNVIILSMHATSEHIHRALQNGAKGYVLKESASKDLVEAVRRVQSGGRYLSDKIMDTVISEYLSEEENPKNKSPVEKLSPRERQVLQLVVEGYSSSEIGEIMNLSKKTIETYRSRIMNKLNIRDLPQLVKFALKHGLTSSA